MLAILCMEEVLKMDKKLIRTSMHLRADSLKKIDQLKLAYSYKTKEIISRQQFIEFILNVAEKEINDMPVAEIVDGKIVYKKEEQ